MTLQTDKNRRVTFRRIQYHATLMVGTSLLAIAPLVLWICVGSSANSMMIAHRIAQNATVRLFIEKRIVSLE